MNTMRIALLLFGAVSASGFQAKTTRYWDCCKPSCAWPSNAGPVDNAVRHCSASGNYLADQNAKNICAGGGSPGNDVGYMCTDQQPWAVDSNMAYGFAASNLDCSTCYELTFTNTAIQGKKMIVQVTNKGGDLGKHHFDIQLPGGGLGIFNGCARQGNEPANGPPQFPEPYSAWGKRYGGLTSISQCSSLPPALQSGCEFRFGWFKNADNPNAEVRRVQCPAAIVAKSGSRRDDDSSQPSAGGDGNGNTGGGNLPQPTRAPSTGGNGGNQGKCPSISTNCGCAWTKGGSRCGADDGSECWCKCCCEYKGGSCKYTGGGSSGGGGNTGGGGGSSGGSCSMPAGLSANPAPVDNRNFVACHGKLKLGGPKNLQLVDSKGQAVQLTGMSSHGLHWFGNCYTRDSIEYLAQFWGVNVFRAAMYVGEGGYASNPSVKSRVHEVVQWCKEIGIYVIIDWHMLNPGNPNDATYSGAVQFFQEMARKYKNDDHVLFETANEPNGVAWGPVKQYHDRVIAAIRAIDQETIIIAGTPTWSQDIHLAAADPVAQPYHVMYTFHFYAGTHMNLFSRVEKYASQIPIFITEWGTSLASGDGGPFLPEAKKFLDMFKSAGSLKIKLSFAQWSYADKNEISAALKPGACGSGEWDKTSCSGTFLKNYIKANAETCSSGPSTPSVTPRPPIYTPRPPVYTPRPPRYTPRPPVYTPRPPVYTPRPPRYTPRPPVYTPRPPVYTPRPPVGGGSCRRRVRMWGNCARNPSCCQSGAYCKRKNQWYAQCVPGSNGGGSGPRPTPVPRTPRPPLGGHGGGGGGGGCSVTLSKWANCHHGKSKCCARGLRCKNLNPWYSQCL